jgi:hypothetical protein
MINNHIAKEKKENVHQPIMLTPIGLRARDILKHSREKIKCRTLLRQVNNSMKACVLTARER